MLRNLKDKQSLSFLAYRFLASMVIVLVCTTILSATSYKVLQKDMSEWSIDINNKLIKNYNEIFKNSIITSSEEIYDQVMRAQYDDSVQNMKELRYFLQNPLQYNLLGISGINQYFTMLAQTNPIINEVGIFITSNHLIISNRTVKYDYFYNFYDDDINFFLSKSEEIKKNADINDINAFAYEDTILIVRPLAIADKINALIFIEYSTEALNAILEKSLTDEMGILLVINKQGVVIYDNSGRNSGKQYSQLPFYSDELAKDGSGYYSRNEDQGNSIVSYMTDNRKWKYVSVIPEQFYMEPVQYILKNLLICMLAALLAGTLFTVIVSVWQSKPINRIIELCNKTNRLNSNTHQYKDAYGFIGSTLTGLISKVNTQADELNKLMPILQSNFVSWFLAAKQSDRINVNDTMIMMRVSFPYENYVIVAVKAVHTSEEAVSGNDVFEINYALAEACMVLESAFNTKDSIGIFTQSANYLTGLVNFSYSSSVFEERCNKLFNSLFHGFHFYTASGMISQELEQLTGTACLTTDLLRYSYLYPECGYFTYVFTKEHKLSEIKADLLHNISEFSSALKHRDAKNASELLNKIVERLRNGGYNVQYTQKIMLEISSLIEKLNSNSELSKKLIVAFQACSDILALRDMLNDIITSELIDRTIAAGISIIHVNAAREYIDCNLTDTQLSLQTVSDNIKVTTQYLSQIFHEIIGMTFTEYINAEKMKLACKLLHETDQNICTISEKLGYSTPQYFIRRFKIYYGVTPSYYRENAKNDLSLDATS